MTSILQAILGYCYAYRATIELATVVLVVAMFVPLVLIRLFCGSRAAWVGWFAGGLSTVAVLYLIRIVLHVTGNPVPLVHYAPAMIELCSMLGNWLFLEAAWRLHRTEQVPWRWQAVLGGVFLAAVLLALTEEKYPAIPRFVDIALSVPCIFVLARGIIRNVGPSRATLSADDLASIIRSRAGSLLGDMAGLAATFSVISYLFIGLVYSFHPLLTDGFIVRLSDRYTLVDARDATDAFCYTIAFLSKAGLCFSGVYVAMRDAVGLGISDRHEIFWAEVGPDDPIRGLVQIADSNVYPSRVALVWSAPHLPRSTHVFYDASERGDAVQIDEEEIRAYLEKSRAHTPPEDRDHLAFVFDLRKHIRSFKLTDVPIRFGGDVIGNLIVRSRGQQLGLIDRHRLEKFVGLVLSPALQARREQALLDVIAERFARAPLAGGVQDVAPKIATELADLFRPIHVRLCMNRGFVTFEEQACAEPDQLNNDGGCINCPLQMESGLAFGNIELSVAFPLRTRDASFLLFHRDPILGMVSRLVSARLLDVLRRELDGHLNDLQDALAESVTPEQLLHAISINLAPVHVNVLEQAMTPTPPNKDDTGGPIDLPPRSRDIYLELPKKDGLLAIPLPDTRQTLHLKVSHAAFGAELDAGTPWRVFLDRLQHVVGSAYTRISSVYEMQDLQLKYARLEGVASAAVSTGLIVHQLANLTVSISATARVLHEQMCLGVLRTDDHEIQNLVSLHTSSARDLHGLVSDLRSYSAFTSENPSSLSKILERNEKMFRANLLSRGIEFSIFCEDGSLRSARINVPFHIAALALANLIENSKAAITGRGCIKVTLVRRERSILCHVHDSGRGVPSHLSERIFDLGVSTTNGSGGWGLPLTRKSLSEFNAFVSLTHTSPEGSIFTLIFPESVI